jgi:hypothetical protein
VACRMKPGDPGEWTTGVVVAHHFRHPSMPAGFAAPYQVRRGELNALGASRVRGVDGGVPDEAGRSWRAGDGRGGGA